VKNCHDALPDDEDREVFVMPDFVRSMIERKILGDKTGGGFYRKTKQGIETLDLASLEYRPRAGDASVREATKALAKVGDPGPRVKQAVASEGIVGQFAWKVLSRSLAYAAHRVGEVCDSVTAIDDGMRWGYNWDLGPFEVWDALGFQETLERLRRDGVALPASIEAMQQSGADRFYRPGEVFDLLTGKYLKRATDPREATLPMLRRGPSPVLKNAGASAWDLGDGVLGVTFETKANTIDQDAVAMLDAAVAEAEQNFRGVLLANTGTNFCVGANLMFMVMAASQKEFAQIDQVVRDFQQAILRMKYAEVPVLAAPFGMTLGGGLELCLGSCGVQAALETYAGLSEASVGLIPAGGGCTNLLWRSLASVPEGVQVDSYAYVTEVFKNIAMVKVSTSAHEAQHLGYFRASDGVSFDHARQLAEAKERLLGVAGSGYHPPVRRAFRLPGESGIATLKMLVNTLVSGGYATEHDALVADKLAHVLCGGVGGSGREVTEQELLDLERETFLSLCGEAKSQARMQHVLQTGKPLRN
jgi:3-hydroxyacyl-CoA dehydrogenase